MPKNYPGFIIDRSRRSAQSKHTDDYVVCTDSECGFIARVYKLNKTQFNNHNAVIDKLGEESELQFISMVINDNVAIVLEVVHYLHSPIVDKPRLKSLLKKALRAYLMGERDAVAGDNTIIDGQIGAVAEMVRLAKSQYDNLVLNNGQSAADDIITHLEGAVKSLGLLKQLTSQFRGTES